MKLMAISSRTAKEILRDPLNLFFGLGFPVILLLLLSAIQANAPVELFALNRLTPGIAVFGLSFMTLFAATLLSRDRESALLQRLYTTPLKASDFIFGYALPLLPMALVQTVICYGTALLLGLQPSWYCMPWRGRCLWRCSLLPWGFSAAVYALPSRWGAFAAPCLQT